MHWSFRRTGVLFVLVVLLGYSMAETTPSLNGVITAEDRGRLRQLFQNAQINSLETAFYVSRGLSVLGEPAGNVQKKVCSFIQNHSPPATSLDAIFYATSVDFTFNCEASFKTFEKSLKESLSTGHNTLELYHIVSSLANIGSTVDEKLLSASKIAEVAEQEETILSYGRAFLTGARLTGGDLTPLMDLVEDVAAQADETPTALYFEGGLETTAFVITGIFDLSTKAGKRPTLSALQTTLFGSYFMSIRFTESVKEAYYVLMASQALVTNTFIVPAGLTQVSRRPLTSENKNFEVRLTNILGSTVGKSTVTLSSLKGPSGVETDINKPFTADKDGITYSYQLFSELKEPGAYIVTLNTQPERDAPVPSLIKVQFSATLSFSVIVSSAEITILEKDQNVAVKTASVEYPGSSQEKLSADHHSKVRMTFQLLNKETKQKVRVHQTFVRLVAAEGEDIYFVATPSKDNTYTFELDVAYSAKESFGSKSGTYSMSLIVGGASVANPFSWDVGSLILKFPDVPHEDVSEDIEYRYKPKPTIEHMFSLPEKRPPATVSLLFSVLVLVPLIVLLPVWLLLGANVSKIGLSGPWMLIFHLGLAGIFMLYYCFWIKLNMFQTLQYLALLGVLTFIGGNRMLRRIAKQ